jgi:hypothetical protein
MAKKLRKHLRSVENNSEVAQAESGNGKGTEAPRYEVGASVSVPPDVIGDVETLLHQIVNIQQQVGALTEEFEARRGTLLRLLAQTRQSYNERVKQLGISMGLNLGPDSNESWLFNPREKTFTRQA